MEARTRALGLSGYHRQRKLARSCAELAQVRERWAPILKRMRAGRGACRRWPAADRHELLQDRDVSS